MAYQRKTQDEYHILVNYGQGWEHDCTELNWKDAKRCRNEYQENCAYPVKIVKKRVKIEQPITKMVLL